MKRIEVVGLIGETTESIDIFRESKRSTNKSLLLFLSSLFTLILHAQNGTMAIPESYITRNNIRAITYFNYDSLKTSRILFTKTGLTKEHAQFVRYPHQDSIIQVSSYEYDSTGSMAYFTYFQYTINSNEFPSIHNEQHDPNLKGDSTKITRYAEAYGHYLSIFEDTESKITYPIIVGDGLKDLFTFRGDTMITEQFKFSKSDSVVFRDDHVIVVFRYTGISLTSCWTYTLRDNTAQLIFRVWFDERGIPIREIWTRNGNVYNYRIEVELWN